MEVLLRSVFSFYWFRYKTPAEIDDTLIKFVAQIIKTDIIARSSPPNNSGNYTVIFKREVIKLYNRNKPKSEQLAGGLESGQTQADYNTALQFLVRQQIYSCSQRLSNVVGAMGDTSIDTILLEEWLPTYNIPGLGGRVSDEYGIRINRFEQKPRTLIAAAQ